MLQSFKYSAFISYSSKDKAWATRLRTDLQQLLKDKPVFLDTDRLEEGKPWNSQLTDALQGSEHIVVLYTENAHKSDWVKHEMSVFNTYAGEEFGKGRRLLCVLTKTDVSPTVYPQIQSVKGLIEAGVYGDDPPDRLGANKLEIWNKVVTRVAQQLRSNVELLPLALVTMTAMDAAELNWEKPDPGERIWEESDLGERIPVILGKLAGKLGINDVDTLRGHYGETRNDWKPFGSNQTIAHLLGQVLGELNQRTHPRTFEWDIVDFLLPNGDWKAQLTRLAKPSVILIDPMSLYHDRIANRLQLLSKTFERDDVLFLTLTPFCIASAYNTLRQLVRELTAPLLDPYFDPTPARTTTAGCAVGISDSIDLRRAILAALLRSAALPSTPMNPYLAPPTRGY